jgi:DNA-directed RNA polymerase subunit RPC12/RpoP
MTRGIFESDVTIPSSENQARCPHCGGDLRIVVGERVGTVAVPVDVPVALTVPRPPGQKVGPAGN